jgi:hypothetical protein
LPCLPIWLTSCAPSIEVARPDLPAVTGDLDRCTDAAVPALPGAPGTGWDGRQVVGIIGDQRRSALAKDRCARDWRSFYQDLRARLAGPSS